MMGKKEVPQWARERSAMKGENKVPQRVRMVPRMARMRCHTVVGEKKVPWWARKCCKGKRMRARKRCHDGQESATRARERSATMGENEVP